jgi:hypothetical protein
MRNFGPQLFFFLLLVVAAITLACGSSAHIPQSVSVTPATADAQSFPGGAVQFTTTVSYNTKPSPVKGVTASWTACSQQASPANLVSISTTGVAKCLSGASGTYGIYAFVPDPTFRGVCAAANVPVGTQPCGGGCGGVVGSAQLICP